MSKRKAQAPKPKQFVSAKLALWAATLTLSVFGAAGWVLVLWDVSHHLAFLAALVSLVAPLVAASMAGPASSGAWVSAGLCMLIFTAMEAGASVNAVWQFDAAANKAVNAPAQAAYEADVLAAKAALGVATDKLVNLPTPDAKGAIRKVETYAQTHAALTANVAAAQARLDALVKPQPTTLFPREVSGTVMALTSIAMILGHLGVARAGRLERKRFVALSDAPVNAGRRRRRVAKKVPPAPVIREDDRTNVTDLWERHRGSLA